MPAAKTKLALPGVMAGLRGRIAPVVLAVAFTAFRFPHRFRPTTLFSVDASSDHCSETGHSLKAASLVAPVSTLLS